jgi:hypothetical protein
LIMKATLESADHGKTWMVVLISALFKDSENDDAFDENQILFKNLIRQ